MGSRIVKLLARNFALALLFTLATPIQSMAFDVQTAASALDAVKPADVPPAMHKESSTIIQAGETLATLNDWRAILFASLFISFCLIGGLFTTLGLFLRTSSKQAEAAAALSTSLMALTASLSELKASHTSVLEALGRIEGQNSRKR